PAIGPTWPVMATRTPRPKKATRPARTDTSASSATSSIDEKRPPPPNPSLAAKIGDVLGRLIRPAPEPSPEASATTRRNAMEQDTSSAPSRTGRRQGNASNVAAPVERPHPNPSLTSPGPFYQKGSILPGGEGIRGDLPGGEGTRDAHVDAGA